MRPPLAEASNADGAPVDTNVPEAVTINEAYIKSTWLERVRDCLGINVVNWYLHFHSMPNAPLESVYIPFLKSQV